MQVLLVSERSLFQRKPTKPYYASRQVDIFISSNELQRANGGINPLKIYFWSILKTGFIHTVYKPEVLLTYQAVNKPRCLHHIVFVLTNGEETKQTSIST